MESENLPPIKHHLEILAKRLNLTGPDDQPEEYILTEAEEQDVVRYVIERAKEHFQFTRLNLGERLIDIDVKSAAINWSEHVDVQGALKTANSNKNYEKWLAKKRIEEKQKELQKAEEIRTRHTARFFYNIMAWTSLNKYGKPLIVADWNRHLISVICFFLSQDQRFETELGYSFKKGLLIRGISGLGKTFLLNCVKDNEMAPITIYSMLELAETVKAEGYLELPPSAGITYLDDVGTEEATINHYGTKINFFKNFIEKYYLNNVAYNRLIVSTNNNFSELEEKYGFRVRSRIKDMFNIIDVVGSDMRG